MRRFRFIAVLPLILALLLAACGSEDDATSTPSGGGSADATPTDEPGFIDLAGTRWELISLHGEELLPEVTITLAFEQGQLGGNAGCNEYGGAFTASDTGDLSITELHNTDMACGEPEGVMELETSYLEALGNATSYQVTGDQLELASTDGETSLVFVPDTTSELDGTSWTLVELDGEPPITGSEITLSFEDGEISGSGGCNTYGAGYTAGDGSLSIEDLMITEMGCTEPEGVLEQEQAYVDALVQAASYRLDAGGDRLEILDGSSEVRIVFAIQDGASQPQEPVGSEVPKGSDEPVGTGNLDGTDWVLTHINGEEVAPDPPGTLIFWADQFMGQYGCLNYHGSLETTPKGEVRQVSVDARGVGCEIGGAPDLSETYIGVLKRITQYRVEDDRLDLLDEIGKIVLSYRPPITAQSGLDNTSWTLVDLEGAQVLPGTGITLNFSKGSAGGNAGCNSYGSPYMVPVEGIISMPQIVSTAMGCSDPPGVEEQETAYLQVLYTVSGYHLPDDRLELTNEAGDVVLVYQPADELTSSLDGTSWDLVTLNGAEPIDGTQIMLLLSVDGWVTGDGSCNDYGREDVTIADGIISIPDVVSTDADCAEPPGVLDQEQAYYDALSNVATYHLDGNTFELMNEAGQTILVYGRQPTRD